MAAWWWAILCSDGKTGVSDRVRQTLQGPREELEINLKHEKTRRSKVIADISLVMTLSTFLLFGLQAKTVKAQDASRS